MTTAPPVLRTLPFGDCCLLLRFESDDAERNWVHAHSVSRKLGALSLEAVLSLYPAYDTVLVEYDPLRTDAGTLGAVIDLIVEGYGPDDEAWLTEASVFGVPVVFGGDRGPDLDAVASELDLSPSDLVETYCTHDFVVRCVAGHGGPMFDTAPSVRGVARLSTPRTRVERGTIMVGGDQFGVVSQPGPSGWRVIGQTSVTILDPTGATPSAFGPGDVFRIMPMTEADWHTHDGRPLRRLDRAGTEVTG